MSNNTLLVTFISLPSLSRRLWTLSVLILLIVSTTIIRCVAQNSESPAQDSTDYLSEVTKNGVIRWTKESMPLHIFIKPGAGINGYRPEFTTMLEQAFSEWAAASNGHISFVLTNDINNAHIICGWTSDVKEMIKLTEGGHALVIPDGHAIKQVRITILTTTTDGSKISDEYFKRVALHEIGHTCGLANHSPVANDIMYGLVTSSKQNCKLTSRDINTLIALYNIEQKKIDSKSLNIEGMLPEKANQSDLARIIRLNAEASEAMNKKDLAVAVAKLEEAHRLDPKNDLINGNLGAAYGNCAMVAVLIRDNQRAQSYFDKALPLLAKSSNKESYLSVLKFYGNYLRSNGKLEEAEQVTKKIKSLTKQ